ncbi:MAG: coniferyl aldehyde dehydrogenase [Candidatus Korobacteraceae bacterium]
MGAINLAEARSSGCGPENLAQMLTQQREAFLAAGAPPLDERLDDLRRLRQSIKSNANRIATLISEDFGNRSRHETLIADVWPVLAAIRHSTKHLSHWMKPSRVPVGVELSWGHARILCQPVGVVGIISPWNYPFQLALIPLMSALAAGNRVMLKPSELTPRTAEFLAEFLARLFPPEKVATVLGDATVGAAFSRLPFDHLLYTGSTAVGRLVMQAAAANLTPVTLELGGKSPCIVGEDARLPAAVDSIIYGKLLSAGQTCIAPDYVLVPERLCEEFIELAAQAVKKFYPSLKVNPDYTSIVNERHYRRIMQYLDEAKRMGARVIELNPAEELFVAGERKLPPTLVVDPDDELALMREEIFGPVLAIKTYRRMEDAIDYVNRRPRPLALYYFGTGRAGRDEILRKTVAGDVSVNNTLMHILVNDLPFGGVGASGIGAYHGEFGFQTFSHRKGVFVQSRINSTVLLRPPYGRLAKWMLKLLMSR